MDIGRVFSTSFAMFRQRFWPLVGMWAVFFGIQIVAVFAMGIGVAVMGLGATGLGADLEDPAALAGMGIGMILVMVLFYGAYIVIALAQQAALVTLASPLEETSFGGALGRGFKSALPFFGIAVILILAYFLVALVVGGGIGLVAAGAGSAGSVVVAIMFLPVFVYLACRFAVLVPVVAVDQVFNPITAIKRSWDVTRGKVLSILLAIVGFLVLSAVAIGVPVGLFVATMGTSGVADPSSAGGIVAIGFLVFIPLFIAYTVFASAFTAAMHSEVTGGGAETFEEVFA